MGSTRMAATVCVFAIGLLPASSAVRSQAASSAAPTIAFVSGLNQGLWLTSNGLVQRPLIRTRSVSDFAWSPDGRRIAFIGSGGLHVINADGSGLRRLPGKPILGGLSWSPDARRFAFTGAGNGSVHVYVISTGGRAPKALAPTVPAPVLPSWSPRGATIAFSSARTDAARIYSIEADGSRLRTLTRGPDDSFPSWSPDGRSLLFQRYACPAGACGYAIHVMRADGSMPRRLVHVPRHPGGGGLSATWSPDGGQIAFLRPRKGQFGNEIVVMDADGKRLRSLTKSGSSASSPAWSPDGRQIAYESSGSVYVMNRNGSGKRLLVERARLPAWQPGPG